MGMGRESEDGGVVDVGMKLDTGMRGYDFVRREGRCEY
jgi:hypothetical protein